MANPLKSLIKPALISFASQFGPHIRHSRQEKLWVLMYHRILPATDSRFQQEEPGMLVTPDSLAMHLREIKKHFEVVSLGDWVKAKEKGEKLPTKACAITFDDGWLDNFEFALPVLKAESTPATLFAVAEKIGTEFQFWPNIIAMLLLSGANKTMCKHPFFNQLASQLDNLPKHPNRDQLANIILQLKQFSDKDIFDALAEINWQELCAEKPLPALMDWAQLKAMQDSGLVEIGSHTCTHRRLTNALNTEDLRHEIITSKTILEERLHKPVNLFCFPNGDYNSEALVLVKEHYQAAVTTRRGINVTPKEFHELTRIGLHDEVSHTKALFRSRLSGWV